MTIRQTAYETKACSGFITSKIVHAIEDLLVADDISYAKNRGVRLIDRNFTTVPVPTFMHPIIVKHNDEVFTVVDVRSCGRFDSNSYEFKVRNPYEFDFITIYGELSHYWLKENIKLLSSISILPISLYSRWISENITKRFGLNPQDQLTISILSAYFYLSQFTNDENIDERDLGRIVGQIVKATYSNAEVVLNVIEHLPYIKSIDDFCNSVKTITGNVRLEDLNVGVLYTILGTSWYGTNAKELVAVAIEFPPAWILLTYASYMDRSYKNTGIAKISIRDKKADIDSFVKSLVTLIRQA